MAKASSPRSRPRTTQRQAEPAGSDSRQPAVGDHAFVVPDPERLLVYRRDDGELVGAGQPAPDAAAQGLRATPP